MFDTYDYSYEGNELYCYRGTDTLINKLDIRDEKELFEVERELVSLRTLELELNPVRGNLDFEHLKKIHEYLFQDLYEWAGEIRTVNIAKNNLFCLTQYIDSYANDIFSRIQRNNYLADLNTSQKLSELIEIFGDINALHCFREGNGRSQREFIESLAKVNGIDLNLSLVEKNEMIIASYESMNGNNDKLEHIFNESYSILDEGKREYYLNNIVSDKRIKSLLLRKR